MKLSLLLLYLLAFQASAKVLTPFDDKGVSKDLGPDALHRPHILSSRLPSQSHHQKRGTRSKCSPPVHNGAQKRDVYLDMQDHNATLDKRIMTVPQGSTTDDMDRFMVEEISNELVNWPILWKSEVAKNVYADTATAVSYPFNRKPFGLGTGGLCGCTTLVIISRRGVYMSHYWESLSFKPEGEDLEFFGSADNAFKETVIKGLEDGIEFQQKPLKKNAIEDNFIKAYLVIPTETDDDVDDGYRPQWNRLKTTVKQLDLSGKR
ncbi:hypothetical protein OIDMADRAFT_45601 [Oidiodendron maius Zn]|uniref:Uncharacterized protein n=1 Tax=Oidiodendron maius (strain Zn) TaxID=913774 RepID=A0A0C3GEU7_OIDMZ|nr:hypothetical protein OIDMADRAFT_45601 [Oidiodendron maius Zn]